MKNVLAIIFSSLTVTFMADCYGQTGFVFKDAATLLGRPGDNADKIIAYYSSSPDTTHAAIQAIIQANPLLKQSRVLKPLLKEAAGDTSLVGVATVGGSGLFGLNVTNFADGLAKFLIERGKQELSMAFFDK